MTKIVRDTGFTDDDFSGEFTGADAVGSISAVDLASDTSPAELHTLLNARIIRITFPTFSDGRGFTLAAQLRRLGYCGRLRAAGHVIADQYAMARRAGFDEIEISDELARRQPQEQWLRRADWQSHDYQTRLRTGAVGRTSA